MMHTEHKLKEEVSDLIIWLDKNRPELAPYLVDYNKVYAKITHRNGQAVHCFIPMNDIENKKLGKVRGGDLLMPATYSQPAKHPRGYLFDKTTWENAFSKYGMRYLK